MQRQAGSGATPVTVQTNAAVQVLLLQGLPDRQCKGDPRLIASRALSAAAQEVFSSTSWSGSAFARVLQAL
jgi:hypothetical protein